jgi:GT2 family glycosyltransferase
MVHEEKTSVIIVTYNHDQYIEPCLDSVFSNNPLEVIIVDNGSTDGTVERVENRFADARLIKSPSNLGYGSGNNLGVSRASGQFVVILNPDTYVEKEWLNRLVCPLETDERTITSPKILSYDGSTVNTCGNIEHFTGLAFTRGLGSPPSDFARQEFLGGLSGACFAMRRRDFLELGGFDERFFAYMEDVEFSWRAKTNDFRFLYVPDSIVHHDYDLKVSPGKIYHLEKGRYMVLRKFFKKREFLLSMPSLLMTEFLTTGYSLVNGWGGIRHKTRALLDAMGIEPHKVECDRNELIRLLDWRIPSDQLVLTRFDKSIRKSANAVYNLNYRMLTR